MIQGYQKENFLTSFVVHISVRKFFLLTNMYPYSKVFLRVLTQALDDLGKIPDLSLLIAVS